MMSTETNLIEILHQRSLQTPNKIGYIFLKDGSFSTEQSLSYHELDFKIRSLAAKLQSFTIQGERAILFYPQGLDYIIAFYACLYAGVIAIPTYSPHRNRPDKRILSIVEDAQPKVVLTTSSTIKHKNEYIKNTPKLSHAVWIDSTVDEGLADDWKMPKISAQTLAFLQYTSGSTGLPKGVQVSHQNIIQNSKYIKTAFQLSENSVSVTWLPSFHDMGLIDGIIQPVYSGFLGVVMPSVTFLQKPLLWLQNISHYKATHCGGPNFGYDLCVQKITDKERQQLDLSSWLSAYNGAEPINKETLERFAQTFAECGFKQSYFYPCYGMAETTLMISGGELEQTYQTCILDATDLEAHKIVKLEPNELKNRDKKTFRELVGCGHIWLDNQVEIVNPETLARCKSDEIGEIWVKGKSVTQGYWQNPEATEKAFNAYIVNTDEGPFLRTGDLGFFDEGELFITGRLKDVIIIRGRNYYPQDIETTLEQSHFTLKTNASAAFSVDIDGEEKLMVAIEVERRYNRERRKHAESKQSLERRHRSDRRENPYAGYTDDRDEPLNAERVIQTIRQNVSEQHGLQVYAVLLLRVGSIPKTSSGKIQRHACRQGFLDGSLNVVGSDVLDSVIPKQQNRLNRDMLLATPKSKYPIVVNAYIHDLICDFLHIPSYYFDWQHTINKLGIDSLIAVELQHRIEKDLGVNLPMAHFLQDTSVAALAESILHNLQIPSPEPTHVQLNDSFYPLSYNQQALWFLHKLAPDSAAYNISFAVDITSPLNFLALRQAFQALTDRHPALRTHFSEQAGQPVQKVQPNLTVDFDLLDVRSWSELAINQYLIEQSHRPFNLEQNNLMRVRVCQYADTEHTLLWVVHHICIDLWSMSILLEELNQLYAFYSQAIEKIDLIPIESHYIDFVFWQQKMLDSAQSDIQEQYWLQKLAGDLSILDLPIDYVRPAMQTYTGASIGFKVDAKMTRALKAMVKASGTTLYTLLLASFHVLLHRYTQQDDILVGSPSAGRCHANFDDIVGYFTNMLVLRTNLAENPSFDEFLTQVQQTVLEALEHQHYPFQRLVEKLLQDRDPSRSPLFQVMFGLQKPHRLPECAPFVLKEKGANMDLGDLHLESKALEQKIAQFDISLLMVEIDGGLVGSWEYNTDLFKPETAQRMVTHFETLLAAIIDNSKLKISELNLLPESEQQQITAWNQTSASYPELTLIQIFEQQVTKTPEAIAVVFGEQSLTYSQLNEKANQLAIYLRKLGVQQNSLVGLCVERSLDLAIAVLGILKAGAAYVPLDIAYPAERLALMLEDSKAAILLTQQHLHERLPETQTKIICLDAEWQTIETLATANPQPLVILDNLAYVIYTSGSTGRPKGVAMLHRVLANLIHWQNQQPSLSEAANTLQFSPISFDVSFQELFSTWTTGGCLFLISEQLRTEPVQLLEFLQSNEIERLYLPFVALQQLAEISQDYQQYPLTLKNIVTAGEALQSTPQIINLLNKLPPCRLHNHYGPSETHVVTAYTLPNSTQNWAALPSIGQPIANTQIYLLNPQMQPVPIGVTGELYIGGDCLAQGYLHRPDLTEQRFILHTFDDNNKNPVRLYKTGDLARYLPDGNMEFLGRIDNQVKIRGFRIELGEIETVINQYAKINESIVMAQQLENSTQKMLVAYIVLKDVQAFDLSGLREWIKSKLPHYMLPTHFIQLERFPTTPSGKINRRALPLPNTQHQVDIVAPKTETQQQLTDIWKLLLKVPEIGIYNNFFELGGHSLLATQLISRIRDTFGLELPVSSLFENPTISEFAEYLETQQLEQVDDAELAAILAEIEGDI
ncbi:MAG: amino acid adenylation domain-containing protein [Thiotrichaceae bacterium]|nr:amino acid adenylation domain-containing protein [Thiotrichaceae bacterium]